MASSARRTPDDASWPSAAADRDSGQRGSLTIGEKVAHRLAVHAAVSTPGVARHATGLSTITGRDLPTAQLHVASNRAAAHLKVAVAWPHPLTNVARAVQRNVADALHTMAGLQVDRVDVEVTHVSVNHTPPPPRVR